MPQASVLIVDESSEMREVLRAALERQGNRIFEAQRTEEGLAMAQQHHPDLIVLDMEARAAEGFGPATHGTDTPIIALATARRQVSSLPNGEFVAKPYHFAPLIRKIEELLQRKAEAVAAAHSP